MKVVPSDPSRDGRRTILLMLMKRVDPSGSSRFFGFACPTERQALRRGRRGVFRTARAMKGATIPLFR